MAERVARILLAEDSPADALLVREALRMHQVACELTTIADGAAALQYIDRIHAGQVPRPDLVLLDLNLPKHSGVEVLQRLRQQQAGEAVPVLVVTTSEAPSDQALAEQFGAVHYFRKPSDLDDYLKIGRVIADFLAR